MRCGLWLVTLSVLALPAQAQRGGSAARLVLEPAGPVLLGEEVTIQLRGLEPGTEYELRAAMTDEWGTRLGSANTFVAGEDSIVDLRRDAPVRGTYIGADRLGIFWSAVRRGPAPTVRPDQPPGGAVEVALSLRRGAETVDSAQLVQWLIRPGTTVREIREAGVVGALYMPAERPRRLVALIGGSGGGMTWQRQSAAILASHGYAAFALAYFGVEGLPTSLAEIPLEYFRDAVRLAARLSGADSSRIALMGLSRGAEASLLLASTFPEFTAVVAFAPSHVSFMGQRPPDYAPVASWTMAGRPLPFVPTRELRPIRQSDSESERHLRYLTLHASAAAAAAIQVERLRGPLLMFAGGVDPIWPSAFMSELIGERLAANRFAHRYHRIVYDSAGHAFARPGYVSTSPAGFSGGNPRANAYAQVDAWRRMLAFLGDWRLHP